MKSMWTKLFPTLMVSLALTMGTALAEPHVPDTIQSEGDQERTFELNGELLAAPHVQDTIQSEGDQGRTFELNGELLAAPHVQDTIQSEGDNGRSQAPLNDVVSPFQFHVVA